MSRLSAVPDTPLRALALIRVSKERGEMIAPEIQQVAIDDHCARRGYVIVARLEALDDSGSQKKSPWWKKLDTAIERVEAGEVDVIVGWKFSRTARNRLRWAVAVDRVETAGGMIESATEPLDVTTSAGRLARGMLAEFNAFEAERIGEVWKEVHARRTKMGLPVSGKPRFGYVMRDGLHRPDDKTGPVLGALYRRYIAGESIHSLARWLNAEGISTVAGYTKQGPSLWTEITMRRVLDAGFGAGFIRVHGALVPGAHEPVIDAPTWEQFLAARASRRTLGRSERSQYLLSGMVRCQYLLGDGRRCDSPMAGGRFGSAGRSKFRCTAVAKSRAHGGGWVVMSLVEEKVLDWLRRIAGDVDVAGQAVARRSPGARRSRRDADTIAREIAALEQELVTATRQHTRGIVPEAAYRQTVADIEADRELLVQKHAQALLSTAQVDAGPIAANLLLDWDALTVAERRTILRSLVARVDVVTGRPAARVTVVPAWGV